MELPSLQYNFDDAHIDAVSFGPRREFTLTMTIFLREGPNYRPVEGIRVRFGGVENLDQVRDFFATIPYERSELAWLEYDRSLRSKPGHLHFEIEFERIDARLKVHCKTLTVSGSLVKG